MENYSSFPNQRSPIKFGLPLPDMDDFLPSGNQEAGPMSPNSIPIPTLPRTGSIPRITGETLVQMMSGHYNQYFDDLYIIDCRFPYEYNGGHIQSAINFTTIENLFSLFYRTIIPSSVIVFHCEFSHNRGPQIASLFRSHDRCLNQQNYPFLSYPNVYILDGGYRNFFQQHPNFCIGNYVTMLDERYRKELIESTAHFRSNVEQETQNTLISMPTQAKHQFLMSPCLGNIKSPMVSKMLYLLSSP